MFTTLLSRLSIRLTAPVVLVLPVLVAAVVLIIIGSAQARAGVHRLASQQLTQIHEQIGEHVQTLLSMPARVDRANLALIKNGQLNPDQLRDWAPVLVQQFLAFETLSAITWGDEEGNCTWVARYAGDDEHLYYAIKDRSTNGEIVEHHVDRQGTIEPQPAGSFPFEPRQRPWYLAPKQAGGPAWSEPFLWAGGADEQQATLGIAYGWPWYDDTTGKLIGVIDADLSLQDISRYLSDLRIGRTGRACLLDAQGLLLASSSGAQLADADGARLSADGSEQAWLGASAAHLASVFGDAGSVDRASETVVNIDGVPEWVRVSPLTHATGINWVIVTVVPEADFMAEVAAGQRRSTWFAGGVTLVTLGLGALLAMWLVRPVLVLSGHVRRLGEGELKDEIQLPYARELVQLSDDINQMTVDLRDRLELRRSLALAMEVQQNLLPDATPSVRGLDIAGHSTYCDETGGDYYDYLEIAELSSNTASLVVGDVMGHGIAAAMLMATARGVLRSRCTEIGSLGELLGHLNNMLVEVTGGSRFMTMILVTIDGTRGEVRISSAGHDAPFIYNPAQDAFIEVDTGGLPLGIMADEHYPEESCGQLPVGSVVVASTDGVWEAQNEHNEQFGKPRICQIIRENAHRSSRDIANALRDGVQAFCGVARQLDDITFVVARRIDP